MTPRVFVAPTGSGIVDTYLRIASGKIGITFVSNNKTARLVADRFEWLGVSAVALTSYDSFREWERKLKAFSHHEFFQLVCDNMIFEGFDIPPVDVVTMAWKTRSYSLYLRQLHLAMRPKEREEPGIIIDHVGNVARHGLISGDKS